MDEKLTRGHPARDRGGDETAALGALQSDHPPSRARTERAVAAGGDQREQPAGAREACERAIAPVDGAQHEGGAESRADDSTQRLLDLFPTRDG